MSLGGEDKAFFLPGSKETLKPSLAGPTHSHPPTPTYPLVCSGPGGGRRLALLIQGRQTRSGVWGMDLFSLGILYGGGNLEGSNKQYSFCLARVGSRFQ